MNLPFFHIQACQKATPTVRHSGLLRSQQSDSSNCKTLKASEKIKSF